jgi:hypothetical protein
MLPRTRQPRRLRNVRHHGLAIVAGEITTTACIDVQTLAIDDHRGRGNLGKFGYDATCAVLVDSPASADIAMATRAALAIRA